jgi:hypothetical protein
MSLPPPPPALLNLTRRAIKLAGTFKPFGWQLPQCNISSNPYNAGATGTFGLFNCIAIQNGAFSAVAWFYLPQGGFGDILGFTGACAGAPYPLATCGSVPMMYVGTNGTIYVSDYTNLAGIQVSTSISPGWHMAVYVDQAQSTSGPFNLSLYLDGSYIGTTGSGTTYSQLYGQGGPYPFSWLGTGPGGWSGIASYPTGSEVGAETAWVPFKGYLAYVALYNRALTSSDVSSIYSGTRVTNGLVAEYVADNYDPASGVWHDDVGGYDAIPINSNHPGYTTLEFAHQVSQESLAELIADKLSSRRINVNVVNTTLDKIGGMPLKNAVGILSNATITSNGSSSNYYAYNYKNFLVLITVGSVSGTSPSLTVSFNAYDFWLNASVSLATVTITSAGTYSMVINNFPGEWFNISWTVGGTSPSFGTVNIHVFESW